tara:strand:- start:1466 stop:1720 length:255 start_codon:yes stop_codon:yes gene_type:complete
MSEPGECQFEVTKYFECVEKNKDCNDVIITKRCYSIIDDYYKCVDIRSYNKSLEKKRARNLKKHKTFSQLEIVNSDYELYKLNL